MTRKKSDSDNKASDDKVPLTDLLSQYYLTRRDMLQISGGAAALAVLPVFPRMVSAQDVSAQIGETVDVTFSINGETVSLAVDPRISVLDLLRERLSLTGTKKGCNQGACGACTILINDQRVNACLALAVMHDGANITTIEGLASGDELHPLQAAFIEHDGFQCGYCTPGQIMSALGCMNEGHAGSREDISYWMSGNICRCGAYPGIVAAVEQAALGDRT